MDRSNPPQSAYFRFADKESLQARRPGRCSGTDFDCKDEHMAICVPKEAIKNGSKECSDGSDEMCAHDEVKCGEGGQCVLEAKFEEDCWSKRSKIACDSTAVKCKEYGECVLKSMVLDNIFECLDHSDEDCEYVAKNKLLTEEELKTKGCKLPSSSDFWDCFEELEKKANQKFANASICKCGSDEFFDTKTGSCKKSTMSTFEFKADKICNEPAEFVDNLQDHNSDLYKRFAAVLLLAVAEVIENSTLEPKPEICFPKRSMNQGSILFPITFECETNSQACSVDSLKRILNESVSGGQSSTELDKNHVKDISQSANETTQSSPGNNATTTTTTTVLSGTWIIIIILLIILLLILLLICLYCCWKCCCADENDRNEQVEPVVIVDQRQIPGESSRDAWSAEKRQKTKTPYYVSSNVENGDEAETHHVKPVVVDKGGRLVDTPTMWEQYQRGKLVISPPLSYSNNTNPSYQRAGTENSAKSVPVSNKTNQSYQKTTENSAKSIQMSNKTSQSYQKQQTPAEGHSAKSVPMSHHTAPPDNGFYAEVERTEDGNFSAGSQERLVPDSEDEYTRWKREMQLVSEETTPEPSLRGTAISHPHVPSPELPKETYHPTGLDSPEPNKYHHKLPKVQKYSSPGSREVSGGQR